MKIAYWFRDKIIAPFLSSLFLFIVIGGGSTYSTGNWWKWFAQIPTVGWILLGVIFVIWISLIIIRNYFIRKEKESPSQPFRMVYKEKKVNQLKYADVIWVVLVSVNIENAFDLDPERITPQDLYIDIPPRCPNCETEMEQNPSILIGYSWKCIKCGFKKHNNYSFSTEAERARKIASRKLEIFQAKENHR